jgi:putative aldouronate transport system substrate-binding protein
MSLHSNISPNYTNFGATPFAQELLRRTGVNVVFEHPAGNSSAAVQEAFNFMVAAGSNMPDIIEYNWVTLVGGPGKALDDRIILPLNDPIDRWAPNLKRVLAANPTWNRAVKTDEGQYYVFPFIRGDEKLLYSQGLMIRQDWLDDLRLSRPTTLQEWHDVLVAFKNQKNAAAPFTMVWSNRGRMFMPTFNILNGMYIGQTDNRVHFGNIETGYREWITTMAQWYREGLIDPDIMSVQTAQQNQKMMTGASGATVASVGSGMGTWTTAQRPTEPRYMITALQYPVRNRGDRLIYSIPNQDYSGQDSPAITATSRNIELATRFLDYGYSAEGHNMYNFGQQGVAWTMVNNTPTWTPALMRGGANNWPLAQALSSVARGPMAGPFVQDKGYIEQYYAEPEQGQALTNYILQGATTYLLPAVTPTQAESQEYASIMQEINTFVDEQTARWLLGTDPITDATWNAYINRINSMNIARAIAIQNAALQRFNSRR